jgi:hypothetical protein
MKKYQLIKNYFRKIMPALEEQFIVADNISWLPAGIA